VRCCRVRVISNVPKETSKARIKATSSTKIVDFDISGLFKALDSRREYRGLSWAQVAKEMWNMHADLNRIRPHDHPISPSTILNMNRMGNTTCQHALIFLQWLGRSPESFLIGPKASDSNISSLPFAATDRRPRWHLRRLYAALDARRIDQQMTWRELAELIGCTPNQLMGIRTARYAINMKLAMRLVQWLERPAADFIYPAQW
jgi:hypothetical protein